MSIITIIIIIITIDKVNLITPWRTVLEKLIVSQLVTKYPAIYGTQRFITSFKVLVTCPYPQPDQANPCPSIPLPEDPP
jgi:hypothetical protein